MQGDGILRLARLNPNRGFEFASAKCQLDHVSTVDLLPRRQLRTNKGRIFPGQFRERPRKFLQPAIVRVTAIQNIWIGSKKELEEHRVAPCAFSGDFLRCFNFSGMQLRWAHRLKVYVAKHTVTERTSPIVLEMRCWIHGSPCLTHNFVSAPHRSLNQRADHFLGRNICVERLDQRLNN